MTSSDSGINYLLRPGKSVSRKMICESLRRLDTIGRIRDYRYIGFGSHFYGDFLLFHKAFGMTDMISVEADVEKLERCRFNRPFDCITVEPGDSNQVLPRLEWRKKAIVWLDYTNALNRKVLADVATLVRNARPLSFLLFTLCADSIGGVGAVRALESSIGRENIPSSATSENLGGPSILKVYQDILLERIQRELNDRAGIEAEPMAFHQVIFMSYQDTKRMMLLGGIVCRAQDRELIDTCRFGEQFWTRAGHDPFALAVPNVTLKEARSIDRQLPLTAPSAIERNGLTQSEIDAYALLYRFFPSFVEAEL